MKLYFFFLLSVYLSAELICGLAKVEWDQQLTGKKNGIDHQRKHLSDIQEQLSNYGLFIFIT